MIKGQKQAVIDYIKACGYTVPSKVNLSAASFEAITDSIVCDIRHGRVSYGKDPNLIQEVRRYVRSMIKNHLNKATELNGGISKSTSAVEVKDISTTLDRNALTPGLLTALDAFTGANDGAKE